MQLFADPFQSTLFRRFCGQGGAFFLIEFSLLINGLTEFYINGGCVVAMNTAEHQAGGWADIALIFLSIVVSTAYPV